MILEFRFFLILCLGFALSGCAASNKVLPPSLKGQVLNTQLVYRDVDKVSVSHMIPMQSYTGGGLLGVLVVAGLNAANQAAAERNARKSVEILANVLRSYDVESKVKRPTISVIKKAKWLDIKSLTSLPITSDLKKDIGKINEDYLAEVAYKYNLISSSSFEMSLTFRVYDKKNMNTPIYSMEYSELESVPGVQLFDGKDPANWDDDGGAPLKAAISAAAHKLMKKLEASLSGSNAFKS